MSHALMAMDFELAMAAMKRKDEAMKLHTWSDTDDKLLMEAVEQCSPLFDHFKQQGVSYSDANAWDAVAGRLLPSVCVTGAACRRRFEIIKQRDEKSDKWAAVIEQVNVYERELAETTFDGVSEILGNIDALFEEVRSIRAQVDMLAEVWKDA